MGTRKSRLRGIPKSELRARIALKRAKKLWHFGPKDAESKNKLEPIEHMVRRLRVGQT